MWYIEVFNVYYHNQHCVDCYVCVFLKLGLAEHHGVGIIGFNSPEWMIADLGAIFAG